MFYLHSRPQIVFSTSEGMNDNEQLTEFAHGGVEQRSDAGDDVMGEVHGLGARLCEEPRVLLEVAAEEAVRGSMESLRPERPLLTSRPPPRPVQRPHGARQEKQPARAPSQA